MCVCVRVEEASGAAEGLDKRMARERSSVRLFSNESEGVPISELSKLDIPPIVSSASITTPSDHTPTATESNDSDSAATEEIDPQTLIKIETRLYSLINELLEVEGMNVIRRNFVVILIKSLRFLFSTSAAKWVHARAKVCGCVLFCA